MNNFYTKELSRAGSYFSIVPLALSQVAILLNTGERMKLLSNNYRFIISPSYNFLHPPLGF